MSNGAIKRKTINYGLNIINYDFPRWHTYEWQNFDVIDAILSAAGIVAVKGVWTNSTAYVVGDRVVDETQSTVWLCNVNHTSAASGTFEDDRTANPSYWTIVTSVPLWRGLWVTATLYNVQDIVREGNAYYLCVAQHTSGTFATDLANGDWVLMIDLQSAYDVLADINNIIALTSIGDLADVDTTTVPPTSGDGLVWNGADWVPGPAGGGKYYGNNGTVGSRNGDIIRANVQTLTTNTTILGTENASAAGPLAVDTGVILTINSGGTLVVL